MWCLCSSKLSKSESTVTSIQSKITDHSDIMPLTANLFSEMSPQARKRAIATRRKHTVIRAQSKSSPKRSKGLKMLSMRSWTIHCAALVGLPVVMQVLSALRPRNRSGMSAHLVAGSRSLLSTAFLE